MYSVTFRLTVLACVCFVAINTAVTHGDVIVQVDGSAPWNPIGNALGGVLPNGTDLDIDFLSPSPTGDTFGIVEFPLSSPEVFDATNAQVSIDFTIGNDNTFATFDLLLFDADGPQNDPQIIFDDLHVYVLPIDGLGTNVRHSITLPLIGSGAPVVTVPIFPAADSMVNFDENGGLTMLGIGFNGIDSQRAQITVHDIRIVTIPEPGCLVLCGLGAGLMFCRRRR